jgi:hypothetical protein
MLGHDNNLTLTYLQSLVSFCICTPLYSSIPFIHSSFPTFLHTIQIYLLFIYTTVSFKEAVSSCNKHNIKWLVNRIFKDEEVYGHFLVINNTTALVLWK